MNETPPPPAKKRNIKKIEIIKKYKVQIFNFHLLLFLGLVVSTTITKHWISRNKTKVRGNRHWFFFFVFVKALLFLKMLLFFSKETLIHCTLGRKRCVDLVCTRIGRKH